LFEFSKFALSLFGFRFPSGTTSLNRADLVCKQSTFLLNDTMLSFPLISTALEKAKQLFDRRLKII